ncbi:hypothetical protein [uncultured Roseibium sp.]
MMDTYSKAEKVEQTVEEVFGAKKKVGTHLTLAGSDALCTAQRKKKKDK